jgi:hypothetical protein
LAKNLLTKPPVPFTTKFTTAPQLRSTTRLSAPQSSLPYLHPGTSKHFPGFFICFIELQIGQAERSQTRRCALSSLMFVFRTVSQLCLKLQDTPASLERVLPRILPPNLNVSNGHASLSLGFDPTPAPTRGESLPPAATVMVFIFGVFFC